MNLKKTLLVGSLFCGVYVFPLYAETPYSESETIEQQKGIRVSGTVIDKEKNNIRGVEEIISTPDSKVTVCVIPTNEELAICRETVALVK